MNKIARVGMVLLLLMSALSCEKTEEEQRVSWKRVRFSVDLMLNNELEGLYSYKVYAKKDIFKAGEYLEAPGVIVFNIGNMLNPGNPFVAYDIRCPYEDRVDITVSVNDEYKAVCPSCKSEYDLMAGGSPFSGPSNKRLQNYCVDGSYNSSRSLRVENCN